MLMPSRSPVGCHSCHQLLNTLTEKWKSCHLWLYLLALGFDTNCGDGISLLGKNMFDFPNSGAFFYVALFLFTKLDPSHAAEVFRNCTFGSVSSHEFRSQCSKWLNHLSNEHQTLFPQVVPSALMSPGGPKFIQLMYAFVRHTLVEDIKMISRGTDTPFAEVIRFRPQDVSMANARCRVAYKKLLRTFQRQDFIVQEYDRKALILIDKINKMQSEYRILETQSCKMKQNDQTKNDKIERIQKVRSMWPLVTEMLESLKKEKEIVNSELDTLKSCNKQHILDGTNIVFSIPRLLAHRVDSDIHQHCTGNIYEAEKLNFLTVIQLLNEALRGLRDEHIEFELNQLQNTENKVTLLNKVLKDLTAKRLQMERHIVSLRESISREREKWEVKWETILGHRPFILVSDLDLEWDLLSSLPLDDFNPAEDDSVFFESLKSCPDVFYSIHEESCEKDEAALETMMDKSSTPPKWICSVSSELSKECDKRDALVEKITKKVMSESPQSDEGKGTTLEGLIKSLSTNPFVARKQIPRTPEHLFTNIRKSWKEAMQTEGSSDTELAPTEVMTEGLMDARPTVQKMAGPKCSVPASPVPDFDLDFERKAQLSSAEFKPQEQTGLSHIIGSPVLETYGEKARESTEAQELKCCVSKKGSVEDLQEETFQPIKSSMSTSDTYSENNSRTGDVLSDHCQGPLMNRTMHWNISTLLNSVCDEAGCSVIWDEMLPEELGGIDLNSSVDSEPGVIDSTCITSVSENKGDITNLLDLESLFNAHKAQRSTVSRSEEMPCQTHNGSDSVDWSLSPSLTLEERERDELCCPVKLFCMEECIKISSPSLMIKEQLNEKLGTEEPSSEQNL
ncbi:HAUS augmin-like complex subunit 6 isoform X2 [Colius striatus]|uniref:HAUS augmin-like complex subunit 6 isoform X2 n=1 Tax=Colius striatus TaxID=57412 RepID=UPI002B1E3AE2|nr:HAUS augmin-like complex subunit 6 isoform X2 [Colius striatus]